MRTARRVDRHARRAERLDVAMDSSFRDLELVASSRGRHLAARLQQQQKVDQPRRSHAQRC